MSESPRPFQAPIRTPPPKALPTISRVKFRQDAAVMAYIIVHWLDDQGVQQSSNLGPYKPLATEEEFKLAATVPNGSIVNFSSYVEAVGEYTNGRWFIVDSGAPNGAEFRQTGTAFKGWFDFEGLYDL